MRASIAERLERPFEATSPEIVNQILEMMIGDQRLNFCKIFVLWSSPVNEYVIFCSTFKYQTTVRKMGVASDNTNPAVYD